MELHTQDDVHAWLQEWAYFEESDCLSARPTAEEYPAEYAEYLDKPDAVVIELAQQCGGGCMAGEVRVMKGFRCTGRDVLEWRPGTAAGTYMDEGVEVIEHEGGLGLDLGPHGRLICRSILIETLPDRTIPVQPQVDPSSVSVLTTTEPVPTPATWIEWFKGAGEDVAWRVFGGPEVPTEQMATDAYAGFLQRRQDIPSTKGGVFVEVRRRRGDSVTVHLNDGRSAAGAAPSQDTLWRIAREALLQFPSARFRTGNCDFSSAQWKRYVHEGVLPDFPIAMPKV